MEQLYRSENSPKAVFRGLLAKVLLPATPTRRLYSFVMVCTTVFYEQYLDTHFPLLTNSCQISLTYNSLYPTAAENNINWNLWSMSSSCICLSSSKERWQNQSSFHRSSYFQCPVPMQDWWPYGRSFQGFYIAPPRLPWQKTEVIPQVFVCEPHL